MFTKSQYYKKINSALWTLTAQIASSNKLSLTDDNHWAEDFFRDFFNIIFSSDFENLNVEERNYAGIDLGDKNKRICIQVTSTASGEKIVKTLKTSDKYNRQNDFDELYVFIIGYKLKYRTKFETKFSNFDPIKHIKDTNDLMLLVRKLDTDVLQQLSDFLDKELEPVLNLDPIELNDEDVAMLIEHIFSFVCTEDVKDNHKKTTFKLTERDENFIVRKNELNNVDSILFSSEIQPSLKYDKVIETFLGNPINSDYLKKYLSCTKKIQEIYSSDQESYQNISNLFGYIFNGLLNYQNRQKVDDNKLLILLHNMYFNCDIGNNPE